MDQQIHITLSFELATGKANLNEIVYRLEQLKNPLMLRILKKILVSYDDLISKRLSHHGGVFPLSKARKGLGRHIRKDDPKGRFCHGRRIRKPLHFWNDFSEKSADGSNALPGAGPMRP